MMKRVAVVLLLLLWPLTASAHAVLIDASVPDGSILDVPPTDITLRFSELVTPTASRVALYDETGLELALEQPQFPAADHIKIMMPPTLRPGSYTLAYRIFTSADGHTAVGRIIFSVGTGAAPVPTNAPIPESTQVAPENAVARAIQLIGAMGLVGGLVWLMVLVWPLYRSAPTTGAVLVRWTIWIVQWSLMGVILGTMWEFLTRMTELGGGQLRIEAPDTFWALATSQWGALALIRTILASLLVPLVFASRRMPSLGWIVLTLSSLMLLSWSASGHAASLPDPLFPIFADWLHALMVAVWLGGVIGLASAAWATRHIPLQQVTVLGRLVPRFTPLAIGSVIMVSTTGAFRAVEHLTTWSDLWATRYGVVLLIKLGLFLGAGLIGWFHWKRSNPALAAALDSGDVQPARRFVRSSLIESSVLILAVAIVGLLVQTPHPVRAAATSQLATTPTPVVANPIALTTSLPEFKITLGLDDTRLGSRDVSVEIADATGPITDATVLVRFDSLDILTGQQFIELSPDAPGSYRGQTPSLTIAGRWNFEVEVQRAGQPPVATAWTVEITR